MITNKIDRYKKIINGLSGQKKYVEKSLNDAIKILRTKKRDLRNIEVAQNIAQVVAQNTQEKIEYHISELVSLALASIFDEPYEFKIDFVIKRGKTEAQPYFIKNGNRFDPLTDSGGGVVDLAAFGLRIALWKLKKTDRNTIILDEPFKFLSREHQPKAGQFLKLISKELGIQFIVVTHNKYIVNAADKIFVVKLKNGVSQIEVLNETE